MKKQILLLSLIILPLLAWASDSGQCGINVNYYYDSGYKKLTISGNGEMYDFCYYYDELSGEIFPPEDDFYAPWIGYRKYISSLVINYGVTSIGVNAFDDCSGLTSVTIPSSVTNIGDAAFQGCSSLTFVTIPSSVINIGYGAFWNCSDLTSVTIPNSVTNIGGNAFVGCSGLTSMIVELGNTKYDSRGNCNAIIETASNSLISGCKNTVIPSSVTSIGKRAFSGCSDLISITIPTSVTSIGERAFSGCSGLTSVTIPSSVTSIGNEAFTYCSGLTSMIVELGNTKYDSRGNCNAIIETASNSLISGCKNTVIPSSVTSIGKRAFSGCSDLISITIPTSVTSIGERAFSGCSGLTSVTVENPIPVSINSDTFSNRTKATLYVPIGSKSAYESAEYWKEFKEIIEIEILPEQTLSFSEIPIKTYGDAAITLPAKTTEGLTLTWSSSDTGIAAISGNTLTIKGSGTATIFASQEGNENYKPFSKVYTLTVDKAPLTITAKSYTITQGDLIPTFEATYSGFKNGEHASVLTTQPTFSCNATSNSIPGTYGITMSGAEAQNYAITYVSGTLTIEEIVYSTTCVLTASVPTLLTGKRATVSIGFDNEDALIAFEFHLQLPDGIRIKEDSNGYPDVILNSERSNRHILEVENEGNGLYYFLCYSNSNTALKGNSGELLNFDIICDDGMEAGVYQAMVKNIKFADVNENPVRLADYRFGITVIDYVMGDVNGDDDIDVMDIVTMVSYMMGRNPSSFTLAAADHTGDGIIDVIDLVKEVSLVMSQPVSNAPEYHSFDALRSGLSLVTDRNGAVRMSLADGKQYVATQFVVSLSEGQQLAGITTDRGHRVSIQPMADNRYFVMSYSGDNAVFSSNDEALTLNVIGRGMVSVEGATFVDADSRKVLFQDASSVTTGIDKATIGSSSSPTDIYSPNGMLMKKGAATTDGLPSGLYIINGKKHVKK